MNYILVFLFNVIFSVFAGFITSRVFNSKGTSTNEINIRKSRRNMILQVALASFISGLFCMNFFNYTSGGFIAIGLMYGMATTVLTSTFFYLSVKFIDARYNHEPNPKVKSGLTLLVILVKSMSFFEFLALSMAALLYGFILLLIPVLGILWGFLMKHVISYNTLS